VITAERRSHERCIRETWFLLPIVEVDFLVRKPGLFAKRARSAIHVPDGLPDNEFMNIHTTTNKENQSQNHNHNQSKVSRDEVAQRAYQLWEAAGQPVGRDLEYWLQAESELLSSKNRCPTTVSAAKAGPELEIAGAPPPAIHDPGTRKLESRKVASTFRPHSGERPAATSAGSKIR
jgi:hypothetical protein